MQAELVVIQLTPFCNLNCRYCYLPDRSLVHVLPLETLERIVAGIAAAGLFGPKTTILWHAGEPLAVGVRYLREAYSLLGRAGMSQPGATALQTNGTLLSQAWCDLIAEHGIKVGVSIDGPEELHDLSRRDRQGRGSYDRVMAGLLLLRERAIPFHLIVVLVERSLEKAEDIWALVSSSGAMAVSFNVEEIEGANPDSWITSRDARTRYVRFLRNLLELRNTAGSGLEIRELDQAARRLLSARPERRRSSLTTPWAIVSFDWQGNYSTFSPELLTSRHPTFGGLTFGNITQGPILPAQDGDRFRDVAAEIESGVEKCAQGCRYFELCGGGSPSNKLGEAGTFDIAETAYCRLRVQRTADLLLSELESDLSRWGCGDSRESPAPSGARAT